MTVRSPLLPMAVLALMLLIFAIDALTPLDIAIAVLHVAVVLLSASAWARRGVLLTAGACMALTLAAFAISHAGMFSGPAFGRLLVSLAAIMITTFLTLNRQAAVMRLLQREESLRRSQLQLEHVTRVTTLGELAGSIAHEVNQPLAAISANGEACLRWMNRPQPDMGEARGAVTRMLESTHRATEVIRRIRALARKSDPQHAALDVNQLIDDTVLLVRRELRLHQVDLRLELDPSLPAVLGDRIQLQQVMINLLINGMQAMADCAPGQASLTLRSAPAYGGGVRVSIGDTGPGIAPGQLPRLFEAFYTTKADGMGMGLPICRSIIEAHGGRIWAEIGAEIDSATAPGTGATLHFSLPPMKESGHE